MSIDVRRKGNKQKKKKNGNTRAHLIEIMKSDALSLDIDRGDFINETSLSSFDDDNVIAGSDGDCLSAIRLGDDGLVVGDQVGRAVDTSAITTVPQWREGTLQPILAKLLAFVLAGVDEDPLPLGCIAEEIFAGETSVLFSLEACFALGLSDSLSCAADDFVHSVLFLVFL